MFLCLTGIKLIKLLSEVNSDKMFIISTRAITKKTQNIVKSLKELMCYTTKY